MWPSKPLCHVMLGQLCSINTSGVSSCSDTSSKFDICTITYYSYYVCPLNIVLFEMSPLVMGQRISTHVIAAPISRKDATILAYCH
mmetsp:Transcript_25109/g.46557  ORF Transcript_25109/g.46557 Transcript_25109/m.46557 type:complete len:86 (+) Transcript_25109:77-334(+)